MFVHLIFRNKAFLFTLIAFLGASPNPGYSGDDELGMQTPNRVLLRNFFSLPKLVLATVLTPLLLKSMPNPFVNNSGSLIPLPDTTPSGDIHCANYLTWVMNQFSKVPDQSLVGEWSHRVKSISRINPKVEFELTYHHKIHDDYFKYHHIIISGGREWTTQTGILVLYKSPSCSNANAVSAEEASDHNQCQQKLLADETLFNIKTKHKQIRTSGPEKTKKMSKLLKHKSPFVNIKATFLGQTCSIKNSNPVPYQPKTTGGLFLDSYENILTLTIGIAGVMGAIYCQKLGLF